MTNKRFDFKFWYIFLFLIPMIMCATLYHYPRYYYSAIDICCGIAVLYLAFDEFKRIIERDFSGSITIPFIALSVIVSFSFLPVVSLFFHSAIGKLACLCGIFIISVLALHSLFECSLGIKLFRNANTNRDFSSTIGLLVFISSTILLSYLWIKGYYPYLESVDIDNQLEQIHGIIPYSNVHTIGHTILIKAILSIYDDIRLVVLVYILLTALLLSLSAAYFSKKGIRNDLVYCFFVFIVPLMINAITSIYMPLKDLPYAVCVGIITLYLMKFIDGYCLSYADYVINGIAIAFTTLFRFNGVLISLYAILFVIVWCTKNKVKACIIVTMVSVVASFGLIHTYAYKVLDCERPQNGFSIQMIGYGLATIVNDSPTEEELKEIGSILPVDHMLSDYDIDNPMDLIWNRDYRKETSGKNEVFNNRMVVALGQHKIEAIKLFIKYIPNHLPAWIKALMYCSKSIWSQYGRPFICNNISLLVIISVFLNFKSLSILKKNFLVFLPVLLNCLSIFISAITNEVRYMLCTFLLFPIVLLFELSNNLQSNSGK